MAALPFPAIKDSGYSTVVLYTIASCLAYTSATCVTGMMAAAAACCDEDDAQSAVKGRGSDALPRGRALGGFRSRVSRGGIFLLSPVVVPFDSSEAQIESDHVGMRRLCSSLSCLATILLTYLNSHSGSARKSNRTFMGYDALLDSGPNGGLLGRRRCTHVDRVRYGTDGERRDEEKEEC
jgi:hypothetical protein